MAFGPSAARPINLEPDSSTKPRTNFGTGVLAIASLCLLGIASTATAQAPQPIVQLLSSFHHAPDEADLRAASSDPEGELRAIVESEATLPWIRERALTALRHFPSRAVVRLYQRILASPDTTSASRFRVLRYLAELNPRAALPALRQDACHADPVRQRGARRAYRIITGDEPGRSLCAAARRLRVSRR
ncbi:MAG: hypothetical protein AAGF12_23225 [Myxococcota bacterium]